jgi:hypothetical protein
MSIGTAGASATGRPVDPDSFTFTVPTVDVNGWTSTPNYLTTLPFSCPYLVFTGLPAGCTVYVEAVWNIEATQAVGRGFSTVIPDGEAPSATLADFFPSFENMYNRVRGMLPHPGRAGEASAAADEGYLDALWNGASSIGGSLLRASGSVFGSALGGFTSTLSQSIISGIPMNSGQPYGRQFAGYLQ